MSVFVDFVAHKKRGQYHDVVGNVMMSFASGNNINPNQF